MIRAIFLIGTTGFWLTMMSLLIGKEFFQLTPIQTAYEVLPLTTSQLRREDQGIYLGNRRIGLSFITLQADEEEEGFFELKIHTYMNFLLLGKRIEMLIKGKAQLDSQLYLKKFALRITTQDYQTELQGQIAKGNINLVIEEKGSEAVRRIIPTKGPVLFSESLDLIWTSENLKVGKRGRLQVFNPMIPEVESIDFHISNKETISHERRPTEVYVVHLRKGEIEIRSWITPEGIMIKKESHTGLLFQREPAWRLYDAMRQELTSPPDLPHLYSIPSNQILEEPRKLSYLKVKVKTPQSEKVLEIKRDNFVGLENIPWPVPYEDAEISKDLKPTPFIQSEDFTIEKTAREIVGDEPSALRASLTLMDWVHQNIIPVPTVSIPSAAQVLAVRKGDCNEYTALFTALARSLGIPTKMVAGLVYQDGRFFYHAWPEVYLGRWVGLDPTFGQAPIDVSHLPLIKGNLKEQINLLTTLGQTKIFILETKENNK